MDRMHTLKYVEKTINKSENMTNKEKADYIENYKKSYYQWLDSLKEKLNNYEPLFTDLEARRSVSPSFNYSSNNLKGEIWKALPSDNKFMISNLGRVKYQDKMQKQKDDKIQWVTLADETLQKGCYVYQLVAQTFLGKIAGDGYHVHHITNDGYYNTTDNLILLTPKEHSYVHGFNTEQ